MDKDNLEQLFVQLKGTYDTEEPAAGHRDRFMAKLEAAPKKRPNKRIKIVWWKPLSIAAALLLLFSLGQ